MPGLRLAVSAPRVVLPSLSWLRHKTWKRAVKCLTPPDIILQTEALEVLQTAAEARKHAVAGCLADPKP